MTRKLAVLFLSILSLASVASVQSVAQTFLTHHTREAVRTGQAQAVGRLPATQIMRLDLVLPVRDEAGLDRFVAEVSDPASSSYRHFLTVTEFTERFGPTQADYDRVVAFAKANGFKVVGGTRDGMEVQIEGPVSAVESAFHLSMHTYQHPNESRIFFAPDREPTTTLPFQLWHVTGLDNYSIPHPLLVKKTDYAKAHGIAPEDVVKHATTGSGPQASYLGSDMRAAYYGGTALTGAGQNLGLWEYEGTDLADLNTYFSNVGQTNKVPITLLSTDGTSISCLNSQNCDDTEQTLDMTQAIGMAPGLSSLVNYIGSNDTPIIAAMTTHNPLPTTIGCSWGWTPVDPTTLDPYFKKMAVQGQNFFAASGDSSTWSASNEAWPADDPYVVSVGGTDLVTASAAGPWKSETAWADSGGGITPDSIAIPSYQQLSGVINSNNHGSTTLRNGPDVSANANFTFYTCANQSGCLANSYGGTSFAAPMWAGYIALVNQQLASQSKATLGFINPTIYAQNVTASYSTDFHDVTSGTSGSYSATTGYDLVTGWGSPNGTGLINALAPSNATPGFAISASPISVPATAGTTGTSTLTTTVSGGFDSVVALTATGQPSGVTVSFSPTSIAAPGSGTSTVSFAVASTVAPGTYTVTVTGTGGGLKQSAAVSLVVTAAQTPAFSISALPATLPITSGKSGTSTVTTTVSGGFNSAIALTATGLPSGVTATFSPTSIAAPGSGTSTVTLAVASTVPAGVYTITVTGAGAGITRSAAFSLTVSSPASASFSISASPASLSIQVGNTATSTITTAISGGFSSSIGLSISGQPKGVSVGLSTSSIPAPGAGSAVATFTVSSTANAGNYSVQFTGTNPQTGALESTSVALTITAPPSKTFNLSLSPSSGYLYQGQSGYAVVSTTALGGFNSAISFSASGVPTGVSASFIPASIAAPGSGTTDFDLIVASNAPTGTYPITITATGGGITQTATLTFQIVAAFVGSPLP